MLRSIRIAGVCAVLAATSAVALPAVAFGQGAGDDQYADPFGDMPVDDQADADAAPAPPPGPTDTGTPAPETAATPVASTPADTAAAGEELPRTGLRAGLLALAGLALLAGGTLIHLSLLRFAPDSGYARALRAGPLHLAPRPPGFEPLGGRRVRRSRRR